MSDAELSAAQQSFLERLAAETGGESARQVSMYAVGAALGMDRETASLTAQELIGLELVEIRSLSGAIGISAAGLEAVKAAFAAEESGALPQALGPAALLDERAVQAVGRILDELKPRVGGLGLPFEALAELMADLKGLAAQLDSPRPKTAIVRETLRSAAAVLGRTSEKGCLATIRALLGE